MDDFELELKLDFLNEAIDLLDSAESAFLRLENERNNSDLLNEIFRLAHNLKGTSKAVGFDQLAELTHVAENLILKLKDGSLAVTNSIVSTLLEFKDKICEMVEGLKADLNANFDISGLKVLIEKEINQTTEIIELEEADFEIPLESAIPDEGNLTKELTTIENDDSSEISQAALDSLRESGLDEEAIQSILNEQLNKSENATKVNQSILAQKEEITISTGLDQKNTHENKPKNAHQSNDIEESIRVKSSRIDKINNVIEELVILQTVISQRRHEFIHDDLTNKSIGMMSKLFKEVQEIAMSLRMLSLKPTFQKMTRIVRDTSKLLGKDVNLQLIGEETEVDKTILEKISDPLVHIIRNAVDHGLETPDERIACGKEAKGNVELFAFYEGSNLVIQITDDGKGIDPVIIKKKAIEKGILTEFSNLSDQEMIQLIFHPGFSTKEHVTEVSGRGVGMDVVKTNIEKLGGRVKLMSKLGEGSSLKIILPLTLAIIEGIVIKAENEKYVLPLTQIFEVTQVKSQDVEAFSGVAKLFKLRGEVLPLFFINNKLGKSASGDCTSHTVIIVRALNYTFGVAVDDILNQQQIVIKKLGEDIRGKKGIIGSAIMSDGMPSLILDLFEFFKDDLKASRGHKEYNKRNLKAA